MSLDCFVFIVSCLLCSSNFAFKATVLKEMLTGQKSKLGLRNFKTQKLEECKVKDLDHCVILFSNTDCEMVLLRSLLVPFGVVEEHPALPPGFQNRMELLKWKRIGIGGTKA